MSAHDAMNPDQFVNVWHATDAHGARQLQNGAKPYNGELFVSNHRSSGYLDEFGESRLHMRVPKHMLTPDPDEDNDRQGWADMPPDEHHYSIRTDDIRPYLRGVEHGVRS